MAAPKKAAPARAKPATKPAAPKAAAKPVAAKATAAKATPAKATAAKATAAKAAPAKATAAKATAAKATAAKATAAKATAAKAAPPKVAAKLALKPTTAKPALVKPAPVKAAPAKATAPAAPKPAAPKPAAPKPAAPKPAQPKAPASQRAALPPGKSSFDAETLAPIREGLLRQREELQRQLTEIEEIAFNSSQSEISGEVSYDEDSADAGSFTFEREKDLSIANNVSDLRSKIDRALHKIGDGTYGICESCGNPIEAPRLAALPHVTLCLKCKKAEERR